MPSTSGEVPFKMLMAELERIGLLESALMIPAVVTTRYWVEGSRANIGVATTVEPVMVAGGVLRLSAAST